MGTLVIVGIAQGPVLCFQSKSDGNVRAETSEWKNISSLGVILGEVQEVCASAIEPLLSGLLLPLPEDGIDVSMVREEHWVIGGRAGPWVICRVDEPCGAAPVTVLVEVESVVDTETEGLAESVQDGFEIPESVGLEGLLEIGGAEPVTKGGTILMGWVFVLPEAKVAGKVMFLGKSNLQARKGTVLNLVTPGTWDGLVRSRSVRTKSDVWVTREE